jgi:uncharacterized protein YlxW (UPF0749 family)
MNNRFLYVENETGYVKDTESSAILMTDKKALAERMYKKKTVQSLTSLQNELHNLRNEVKLLKTLVLEMKKENG